MYAGDELYSDEVTSGVDDEPDIDEAQEWDDLYSNDQEWRESDLGSDE